MDEQKVVILEGCDGTGKTHIVEALSEELEINKFRPTGQTIMREGSVEEVGEKILEGLELAKSLKETGESLILDRYYPSEWVYSQVFDREFQEDKLKLVDEAFAELETIIVICYKSFFVNYEDDIIDRVHLQTLQMKYLDFADWTKCKAVFLDTTRENLKKEVGHIVQWINL